jgi:hypothetical protein
VVTTEEDLGVRGAHIVASRLAAGALRGAPARAGAGAPWHALPATSVPRMGVRDGGPGAAAVRGARPVPGPRRPRSARNRDTLRNAVHDYPATYAFAASLTAAVTATAIVVTGRLLSRDSPLIRW